MDGMVGPSSGGYQGVSQIWAISTGGETYRREMPGLLGGVHVLMSALLSYCTIDRKKRSLEELLFLYRNRTCFRKKYSLLCKMI